jgi:hypothetical protein
VQASVRLQSVMPDVVRCQHFFLPNIMHANHRQAPVEK